MSTIGIPSWSGFFSGAGISGLAKWNGTALVTAEAADLPSHTHDDRYYTESEVTTFLAGKQPLDTDLSAIAALTSAANKMPYATGAGTWALADLSAFARTILDDADAGTVRSTIGAGTSSFSGSFTDLTSKPTTLSGYSISDAQPLDSDLTAIAALTTTAFGRGLLTETNAASLKTTISLNNVENTALSTWAGTTNITTLGTITTGTWQGAKVTTTYGGTGLTTIGSAYQVLGVDSAGTALEYRRAWVMVAKTAETQAVNNSTALVDDDTLLFAMVANGVYVFEALVQFTTAAAADFKLRHTGPASPTAVQIWRWSGQPSGNSFLNIGCDAAYSAADYTVVSTVGTTDGYVYLRGIIQNGSTAGNFKIQWAQNSGDVSDTKVRAGSFIKWTRLS